MTQLIYFLMQDQGQPILLNIMVADNLVTQGARASATMILTTIKPLI